MDSLQTAALAGSTGSVTKPLRYLFQFYRGYMLTGWRSIDDVVMGGVSSSALEVKDSALVFSGQVSLANNGGFASVRSPPLQSSIPDAKAFVLRVMGDDKSYKINVKTDAAFDIRRQGETPHRKRAKCAVPKTLPV